MTLTACLAIIGSFVFGCGYSWLIAYRPFPSGLTWLSVVVGCSFTNLMISILLWELTQEWRASVLIPWGAYVLTGLPMVLGQILREHSHVSEACRFIEECRRDEA